MAESIVHSLTLPDAGTELYEFVKEWVVVFGGKQRKAILNFLEYPERCEGINMQLRHAGRLKEY